MRENVNVKDALVKKSSQIEYAARLLLEKTADWQMIRAYMVNRHVEMQLTEQQEKKLERYQFIYNQLVSGKYTEQEIVNSLCNKKLFNLKITQAYEDIRCTKELFSACININKQFEIQNEIQILKAARSQCLELHDFKNAAAISKVLQNLFAMLPDEEDSPGEMFHGHVIEPVFDPSILGAPPIDADEMKSLLSTINKKHNTDINVELFEEIKEENGTD